MKFNKRSTIFHFEWVATTTTNDIVIVVYLLLSTEKWSHRNNNNIFATNSVFVIKYSGNLKPNTSSSLQQYSNRHNSTQKRRQTIKNMHITLCSEAEIKNQVEMGGGGGGVVENGISIWTLFSYHFVVTHSRSVSTDGKKTKNYYFSNVHPKLRTLISLPLSSLWAHVHSHRVHVHHTIIWFPFGAQCSFFPVPSTLCARRCGRQQ